VLELSEYPDPKIGKNFKIAGSKPNFYLTIRQINPWRFYGKKEGRQ
jgi:hypothetical protein